MGWAELSWLLSGWPFTFGMPLSLCLFTGVVFEQENGEFGTGQPLKRMSPTQQLVTMWCSQP